MDYQCSYFVIEREFILVIERDLTMSSSVSLHSNWAKLYPLYRAKTVFCHWAWIYPRPRAGIYPRHRARIYLLYRARIYPCRRTGIYPYHCAGIYPRHRAGIYSVNEQEFNSSTSGNLFLSSVWIPMEFSWKRSATAVCTSFHSEKSGILVTLRQAIQNQDS